MIEVKNHETFYVLKFLNFKDIERFLKEISFLEGVSELISKLCIFTHFFEYEVKTNDKVIHIHYELSEYFEKAVLYYIVRNDNRYITKFELEIIGIKKNWEITLRILDEDCETAKAVLNKLKSLEKPIRITVGVY